MKALQRLRKGAAVFGIFQTFPDAGIAELAVWCGYDFVILDCEHGVADEAAQLHSLRAIANSEAFSIVRVRPGVEGAVARYLDFGADGVMVPDVRTPEHAKRIAFAALERWTGGLRGDRYGFADAETQAKPLVMVLIESVEGVDNIDAILDIEGIDGVIIGSGDLSTQLGIPGNFAAPAYRAAVDKVEAAARARGKIIGAKPYEGFPLATLLERGNRLIMIGRDVGLFKKAFVENLAAAKKLPSP